MKPRCVVVDDDVEFLDRVKRTFVAACLDYELVAFSNSVSALDYIRSRRVDLILTAYLVRQIDGLQLISVVRSFNRHVPILMLSRVPLKAAALARGATAFLAKGSVALQLGPAVAKAAAVALPRG